MLVRLAQPTVPKTSANPTLARRPCGYGQALLCQNLTHSALAAGLLAFFSSSSSATALASSNRFCCSGGASCGGQLMSRSLTTSPLPAADQACSNREAPRQPAWLAARPAPAGFAGQRMCTHANRKGGASQLGEPVTGPETRAGIAGRSPWKGPMPTSSCLSDAAWQPGRPAARAGGIALGRPPSTSVQIPQSVPPCWRHLGSAPAGRL
jgi:hypothetical protein